MHAVLIYLAAMIPGEVFVLCTCVCYDGAISTTIAVVQEHDYICRYVSFRIEWQLVICSLNRVPGPGSKSG